MNDTTYKLEIIHADYIKLNVVATGTEEGNFYRGPWNDDKTKFLASLGAVTSGVDAFKDDREYTLEQIIVGVDEHNLKVRQKA